MARERARERERERERQTDRDRETERDRAFYLFNGMQTNLTYRWKNPKSGLRVFHTS